MCNKNIKKLSSVDEFYLEKGKFTEEELSYADEIVDNVFKEIEFREPTEQERLSIEKDSDDEFFKKLNAVVKGGSWE